MPEHFHVLIWPAPEANPSQIDPVKRGLVKHPGDWPWSSWRFYFWNDDSILRMDKMV